MLQMFYVAPHPFKCIAQHIKLNLSRCREASTLTSNLCVAIRIFNSVWASARQAVIEKTILMFISLLANNANITILASQSLA